MPFDHHLGDAISNRGDPQRAHPAIALRYVDPPHRWRKVAAGRQTIPKFIEVVFKISLKIRNHLAVYASRPLVGSDPLIGFPHLPFRNVIRLGSRSCPMLWCKSGVDLDALRRVWPAAQAATAGSLTIGSSLNGAIVSSVM